MKKIVVFLSVFALLWGRSDAGEEKHYLAVGAIFRDEAPYLKEWIEYHKLLGATHFYLYNHQSVDAYAAVLQPYVEKGEVDLIQWEEKEFPACQLTAYRDLLKKAKGHAKWLAIIDIDEFIVPVQTDTLVAFLKLYEGYAGVVINWQLFGTSNLDCLPQGALLIEHLTFKFPRKFHDPSWNSNFFVKSIVQPEYVRGECWSSHYFDPIEGYAVVDANGEELTRPYTKNPKVPVDLIQINHYWFRTRDWFFNTKMVRREGVGESYSREKIERLFRLGHEEEDLKIQRFVQRLKERMPC